MLGPGHPALAYSLINLGHALFGQGELVRARGHYQRALTILDEALGLDHPDGAYPRVGLAKVAIETGDPASALRYAERAVSIRETAAAAPQLLAEARFMLARALWSTKSKRARARALAEQARDALAAAGRPGESDIEFADVDAWLARHRVQ